MRVTQSMMRNRYMRNYNNSLSRLNKLSNQNTSLRKFERTSEDVVGSTRALTIRDELSRNEAYISNLEEAKGVMGAAETALTKLGDIGTDVYAKLLYALNSPSGETGREVLAQEIRTLAGELVKVANTDYVGKYVLGGSNNSTPPFVLSADGKTLTFNGKDVNSNNPATNKPYTAQELEAAFPMNKEKFMDVGLGLTVDEHGNVDSSSAMSISTPGIRAMGNGVDADGDPKNLYNLCMKIADVIESPNYDNAKALSLVEKIKSAKDNVLLDVTNIGDRCNFIDFNIKRFENNILSLKDAQNMVESVDPAEVITEYQSQKYMYQTTLSMGTKLLQQSIFDFMR
ncbi:MAG: flagellar hook-associated protein FlgL [Oscillospiraceae bacterium]